MLKREMRHLINRDEFGRSLGVWDGPHILTWAKAPWGWMLLDISPCEAEG